MTTIPLYQGGKHSNVISWTVCCLINLVDNLSSRTADGSMIKFEWPMWWNKRGSWATLLTSLIQLLYCFGLCWNSVTCFTKVIYSYLLLHLLFCSSHSINLCVHTLKSCVCLKQIRFFLWPFYDILWSLCKNNLLPWFFILIIYFNFWFLQKTNSKVLTFVDCDLNSFLT